jgi:hypothetical protein
MYLTMSIFNVLKIANESRFYTGFVILITLFYSAPLTPAKPANAKNGKANNTKSEALVRRTEQIDQAVAFGQLGPLEGEFMKLRHNRTDDPQAKREAVRSWQESNGADLKAERLAKQTRRVTSKNPNEADRAQATAHRTQPIDQAVATSRLGPLEGEFMKLMHNRGNDHQAERETVRTWQQKHGEALKAERIAKQNRRTGATPQPKADRIQATAHRNQQIDQAVTVGRLGPLEGEFMKLMHNRGNDPQADRGALRSWQKENHEALKVERKVKSKRESKRPTKGKNAE